MEGLLKGVLLFYLYSITAGALAVLLVMWNNECHDELTTQIVGLQCSGSGYCVEFLSTYLMMCKYGIHNQNFLTWTLYYTIIASIVLTHFALSTLLTKVRTLILNCFFVLQFVGISLVFMFDASDTEGRYYAGHDVYIFHGYTADTMYLHRAGVVIFLFASLSVNLILLAYLIQSKKFWEKWSFFRRAMYYDEFADFFYMVTIILFLGCFLLNFVQPAIILEYVVILAYYVMQCLVVYFYIRLPSNREIYKIVDEDL